MSMSGQVPITCQECGKESQFTIWKSINTMLDPEMKSKVRDKSAFLFTCPHCGHSVFVDYGFLYHQMEDQIMIHYAQTEEAVREIYDYYVGNESNELLKDFPDLQAKYLNRIVRSPNQLLEKLAIFDAGLDDRIIEICKVFILSEYLKQHPECSNPELLMFTDKEKGHIIQVIDNHKTAGYTALKDEYYTLIKNKFLPRLKDIREDREPVIDQAWALKFMNEKESE